MPMRALYLIYGVACYALFLITVLYAIGFVGNFWQPLGLKGELLRSMDSGGPVAPLVEALVIDALLVLVFGIQHSVMARAGFKRWWTRLVPAPIERSSFVLASSLCLALLFWQWRSIAAPVLWDWSDGPLAFALVGISGLGWLFVLASTFMLDHFELFGLSQVWFAFRGKPRPELEFSTPGFYRAVRHPIYLGFMIAFWATPIMTLSHFLFAAGTTAYILVAVRLEERDLVRHYGETYRDYRRRVRMLLPLPVRRSR